MLQEEDLEQVVALHVGYIGNRPKIVTGQMYESLRKVLERGDFYVLDKDHRLFAAFMGRFLDLEMSLHGLNITNGARVVLVQKKMEEVGNGWRKVRGTSANTIRLTESHKRNILPCGDFIWKRMESNQKLYNKTQKRFITAWELTTNKCEKKISSTNLSYQPQISDTPLPFKK